MGTLAALLVAAWFALAPGHSPPAAPALAPGHSPPAGPARVPAARETSATPLGAAAVMTRYLAALAALRRPPAVSFEFALSQLGLHDMEQTHRVYRSGRSERDETLAIDGYTLKAPSVRIINGRSPHYDIATVAPRPDTYRFTPVAARKTPGGYAYVFRTALRRPRAFGVREIEVDSRSFLPAVVRFATTGNGARGAGELRYGRAELYWVVREAAITARLRDGKRARERIVWTRYRFPPSLPAQTFRAPRPRPRPSAVAPVPGLAPPPAPGVAPPPVPRPAPPAVTPARKPPAV